MTNKLSRREMLKAMGASAAGAGMGFAIPGKLTFAEANAAIQAACVRDQSGMRPCCLPATAERDTARCTGDRPDVAHPFECGSFV